jgi:hypothetical protein
MKILQISILIAALLAAVILITGCQEANKSADYHQNHRQTLETEVFYDQPYIPGGHWNHAKLNRIDAYR